MEHNRGRGSLTRRYLAALLAPAVVGGVMLFTWPLFNANPVSPYLLAVMFCAWYGGLGPGLLSVLISFLLSDYFFIQPYFSLSILNRGDLVRLLVLATVGPLMSWLSELMHKKRRLAEINRGATKRAQESLREKERFVNQIAELSPVVISVFDLATRREVYISPDIVNLLGYTPTEIAEMEDPFSVLRHPEDTLEVNRILARLNHSKHGEIVDFEYRMRRRDGEWRWVASRIMPFKRDEHGILQQIITATHDITERKRAEGDLRQQKEILQTIFDHIPVMIRLASPDGKVQLVNREYERTTGWTLKEIQNNSQDVFAELYPDKHQRQVILDRIASPRGEWADFRTRVRDGRVIDTSWTEIHLSAGMSLGIGQDISDRKRAEETLRSFSRQLIEAQEAERQQIARELHDQIGQVLTAVRINLQTVGNSSESEESGSLIAQGMGLIDAALEQVRNLSFELRPSLLDDLGLVAALRWYSDQYTQRTGIRTRSVSSLPGGQTRLRQELETACFRIVQEALTNVVRHANAKNVSIDLRKLDHKIVLSIKDDGIGFKDLAPDGSACATRLGLRGMRERALAVGGTLEIESAPARGTEIRAYLPTESNGD